MSELMATNVAPASVDIAPANIEPSQSVNVEQTASFDFAASLGEHSNLAERYNSPQALAQAYKELQTAYGTRTIPPEGNYTSPEVEGFAFDNAQIEGLSEGCLLYTSDAADE